MNRRGFLTGVAAAALVPITRSIPLDSIEDKLYDIKAMFDRLMAQDIPGQYTLYMSGAQFEALKGAKPVFNVAKYLPVDIGLPADTVFEEGD